MYCHWSAAIRHAMVITNKYITYPLYTQVVDTAENKIVLIDSLHIQSVSVAENLKLVYTFTEAHLE